MATNLNAPLRRLVASGTRSTLRIASRRASPSPSTSPLQTTVLAYRPFSLSQTLHKKRKISAPPSAKDQEPSSSSASAPSSKNNDGPQPDPEDPLDFSAVTSTFGPMDAHFKTQLHALLHGGRFNPDSLASLSVPVRIDPDEPPQPFPLGELAQVVPRSGRTISLLVNDREYIKPIMSAVQSSRDFNQQPQRSEDNDLELLLRVEMERKEDVVKRLRDLTQTWRERVRHARTKHDRVLKDWKKNKVLTADVARKAEQELQKVQDKKMKEIDDEEAKAKKQLERNLS